ncbi:hypothetical protein Phum_PHUM524550 [Pediculus humanus corporis]|uniref:Uncharacterized protein n=1 Tax=Pediculus humanus subsp. corporis TaxID=121224 RepID=E0VZ44_PEDHC|nr:uncharacterized protein Phum_PHUM524550 [Pediculus humanus corporis]EEB18650.1 hypothetical protein Phum_PHUM524550 [Pediculus humanus corporis]
MFRLLYKRTLTDSGVITDFLKGNSNAEEDEELKNFKLDRFSFDTNNPFNSKNTYKSKGNNELFPIKNFADVYNNDLNLNVDDKNFIKRESDNLNDKSHEIDDDQEKDGYGYDDDEYYHFDIKRNNDENGKSDKGKLNEKETNKNSLTDNKEKESLQTSDKKEYHSDGSDLAKETDGKSESSKVSLKNSETSLNVNDVKENSAIDENVKAVKEESSASCNNDKVTDSKITESKKNEKTQEDAESLKGKENKYKDEPGKKDKEVNIKENKDGGSNKDNLKAVVEKNTKDKSEIKNSNKLTENVKVNENNNNNNNNNGDKIDDGKTKEGFSPDDSSCQEKTKNSNVVENSESANDNDNNNNDEVVSHFNGGGNLMSSNFKGSEYSFNEHDSDEGKESEISNDGTGDEEESFIGKGNQELSYNGKLLYEMNLPPHEFVNTDYHKNFVKSLKRFKSSDSDILNSFNNAPEKRENSKNFITNCKLSKRRKKKNSSPVDFPLNEKNKFMDKSSLTYQIESPESAAQNEIKSFYPCYDKSESLSKYYDNPFRNKRKSFPKYEYQIKIYNQNNPDSKNTPLTNGSSLKNKGAPSGYYGNRVKFGQKHFISDEKQQSNLNKDFNIRSQSSFSDKKLSTDFDNNNYFQRSWRESSKYQNVKHDPIKRYDENIFLKPHDNSLFLVKKDKNGNKFAKAFADGTKDVQNDVYRDREPKNRNRGSIIRTYRSSDDITKYHGNGSPKSSNLKKPFNKLKGLADFFKDGDQESENVNQASNSDSKNRNEVFCDDKLPDPIVITALKKAFPEAKSIKTIQKNGNDIIVLDFERNKLKTNQGNKMPKMGLPQTDDDSPSGMPFRMPQKNLNSLNVPGARQIEMVLNKNSVPDFLPQILGDSNDKKNSKENKYSDDAMSSHESSHGSKNQNLFDSSESPEYPYEEYLNKKINAKKSIQTTDWIPIKHTNNIEHEGMKKPLNDKNYQDELWKTLSLASDKVQKLKRAGADERKLREAIEDSMLFRGKRQSNNDEYDLSQIDGESSLDSSATRNEQKNKCPLKKIQKRSAFSLHNDDIGKRDTTMNGNVDKKGEKKGGSVNYLEKEEKIKIDKEILGKISSTSKGNNNNKSKVSKTEVKKSNVINTDEEDIYKSVYSSGANKRKLLSIKEKRFDDDYVEEEEAVDDYMEDYKSWYSNQNHFNDLKKKLDVDPYILKLFRGMSDDKDLEDGRRKRSLFTPTHSNFKREIDLDESMPNDFQNFLVTSLGLDSQLTDFGSLKREIVKKDEPLENKKKKSEYGNKKSSSNSLSGGRLEKNEISSKPETEFNTKKEKSEYKDSKTPTQIRIQISKASSKEKKSSDPSIDTDSPDSNDIDMSIIEKENYDKNKYSSDKSTSNSRLNVQNQNQVIDYKTPEGDDSSVSSNPSDYRLLTPPYYKMIRKKKNYGIHNNLITNPNKNFLPYDNKKSTDNNLMRKNYFEQNFQSDQKIPTSGNHLPQVETVYNPTQNSNKAEIRGFNQKIKNNVKNFKNPVIKNNYHLNSDSSNCNDNDIKSYLKEKSIQINNDKNVKKNFDDNEWKRITGSPIVSQDLSQSSNPSGLENYKFLKPELTSVNENTLSDDADKSVFSKHNKLPVPTYINCGSMPSRTFFNYYTLSQKKVNAKSDTNSLKNRKSSTKDYDENKNSSPSSEDVENTFFINANSNSNDYSDGFDDDYADSGVEFKQDPSYETMLNKQSMNRISDIGDEDYNETGDENMNEYSSYSVPGLMQKEQSQQPQQPHRPQLVKKSDENNNLMNFLYDYDEIGPIEYKQHEPDNDVKKFKNPLKLKETGRQEYFEYPVKNSMDLFKKFNENSGVINKNILYNLNNRYNGERTEFKPDGKKIKINGNKIPEMREYDYVNPEDMNYNLKRFNENFKSSSSSNDEKSSFDSFKINRGQSNSLLTPHETPNKKNVKIINFPVRKRNILNPESENVEKNNMADGKNVVGDDATLGEDDDDYDVMENVIGKYIMKKSVNDNPHTSSYEQQKNPNENLQMTSSSSSGKKVKRSIENSYDEKKECKRLTTGHLTESNYRKYHKKNLTQKRNVKKQEKKIKFQNLSRSNSIKYKKRSLEKLKGSTWTNYRENKRSLNLFKKFGKEKDVKKTETVDGKTVGFEPIYSIDKKFDNKLHDKYLGYAKRDEFSNENFPATNDKSEGPWKVELNEQEVKNPGANDHSNAVASIGKYKTSNIPTSNDDLKVFLVLTKKKRCPNDDAAVATATNFDDGKISSLIKNPTKEDSHPSLRYGQRYSQKGRFKRKTIFPSSSDANIIGDKTAIDEYTSTNMGRQIVDSIIKRVNRDSKFKSFIGPGLLGKLPMRFDNNIQTDNKRDLKRENYPEKYDLEKIAEEHVKKRMCNKIDKQSKNFLHSLLDVKTDRCEKERNYDDNFDKIWNSATKDKSDEERCCDDEKVESNTEKFPQNKNPPPYDKKLCETLKMKQGMLLKLIDDYQKLSEVEKYVTECPKEQIYSENFDVTTTPIIMSSTTEDNMKVFNSEVIKFEPVMSTNVELTTASPAIMTTPIPVLWENTNVSNNCSTNNKGFETVGDNNGKLQFIDLLPTQQTAVETVQTNSMEITTQSNPCTTVVNPKLPPTTTNDNKYVIGAVKRTKGYLKVEEKMKEEL